MRPPNVSDRVKRTSITCFTAVQQGRSYTWQRLHDILYAVTEARWTKFLRSESFYTALAKSYVWWKRMLCRCFEKKEIRYSPVASNPIWRSLNNFIKKDGQYSHDPDVERWWTRIRRFQAVIAARRWHLSRIVNVEADSFTTCIVLQRQQQETDGFLSWKWTSRFLRTGVFLGKFFWEKKAYTMRVGYYSIYHRDKYTHIHNDLHSSLSARADGDEYSEKITPPNTLSSRKDGIVVLNISKPCYVPFISFSLHEDVYFWGVIVVLASITARH